MEAWILIYTFMAPHNQYFNRPVILDHFTTRAQCELALDYITTSYNQVNIVGDGHCWGEEK
jgi:hypothetical protein